MSHTSIRGSTQRQARRWCWTSIHAFGRHSVFSHWAGVNFPSLLFELARGWVPRDCEMFVAEPCAIRTTLPYAPAFGDGHGIGTARATRHAAMARSRTLLSDPVPNLVKLLGRYWRRAARAVVAAGSAQMNLSLNAPARWQCMSMIISCAAQWRLTVAAMFELVHVAFG